MTQSEAVTRSELIDKQLILSGWDVKDHTQVVEEYDILTALPEGVAEPRTLYEGHQFSDYVLLGKNGKPLAVVEAKKSSKDAAIGREQAKQYCHNIRNQLGGELPFCFYTNGLVTSVKLQPKGKELKPQLPLPVRLVGLRLDKIKKAIPRNKEIMRVFRDLEIVEQLGSGVPRILEKYGRDAFEIRPNFLRVIFRYEKPFNEQIVESGVESGVESEMALQIMTLLMSASLSKTEIASALGKPKPTRYLNDLVKKLLEAGQVAYGIPDKPNSRLQKYRLTDKGRALLIKLDQGK